MNNKQDTIWTKHRIRLFAALGVILILGAILVLNNLRPVSARKKNNSQRIDSKKEVQKTQNRINILTDSIKNYPTKYIPILNRARLYASINKFDSAIVDYDNFIKKTIDNKLKPVAEKELTSIKNVKKHLEKIKK